MKRATILLCALAVVLAGCGDAAEPATTIAPDHLSLSGYLVAILELEQAVGKTGPPPTSARLMATYDYGIAGRYRDTMQGLASIAPPPEAAAHHGAYRELAELGSNVFTQAAEAWLAGEGTEKLAPKLLEVGSKADELGAEFQRLLLEAFAAGGSPLDAYLARAVVVRDDFSSAYSSAVAQLQPIIGAGDPAAISSSLSTGADTFSSFLDEWDALDPPAEAAETHDMQRGVIVEITGIFSDMVAPAAAGDDATLQEVAGRMEGFLADVAATDDAWSGLMIAALRAHGGG